MYVAKLVCLGNARYLHFSQTSLVGDLQHAAVFSTLEDVQRWIDRDESKYNFKPLEVRCQLAFVLTRDLETEPSLYQIQNITTCMQDNPLLKQVKRMRGDEDMGEN